MPLMLNLELGKDSECFFLLGGGGRRAVSVLCPKEMDSPD